MKAEEIVGKLSEAQKAYLTVKATWRAPTAWAEKRWMAFPPSNTHSVLKRLGLMNSIGAITDDGLEVKALLEKQG